MPPDPARRLRPRITLRQIGVFVAFVAIAMAVLTPIGRSTDDPWFFALLSSVELPYVLLIPTLVLVRRGSLKHWFVAFLCGIPLASLLAYVNFVAVTRRLAPDLFLDSTSPPIPWVVATADLLLLAALVHLVPRLIPRRCPTCSRQEMLLDPSVPQSRDFPGRGRGRICLACGCRFRRLRRGPWVEVDAIPGPSESPILSHPRR